MRIRLFVTLALVLLPLAGCSSESPVGPPPVVIPADGESILYSRHIEPIFMNSCGGTDCHLAGSRGGGYAVDTWEKVMAGADDGTTEVIPFTARRSHLFQHLNRDSAQGPIATPGMPLSRDPLPAEQIRAIVRWINEGARNDAGTVALAGENRWRAFISAAAEDVVAVFDGASGLVARYLDVHAMATGDGLALPAEPVIGPDGSLYVALTNAARVVKFNGRTLAPAGSVAVAAAPAQTIVAPDGRRLYVAHHNPNQETQQVSVIDAASMQVVGVIDSVGRAPHGVVIAADGTRLYTMNTLGDDIGVVDLASGRTLMRIPVSSNNPLIPGFIARYEPYGGLLTNNGTMLWVTCRRSGEVRVIDLAAGRVVDSIFVGVQPLAPALAADGHTLWVPNRVTNTISVLDTRTHSTIATIRDITTGPTCIGFSSDGATAYVACEKAGDSGGHGMAGSPGVLYVLDANTYNVRNSLELASGPIGMAILR